MTLDYYYGDQAEQFSFYRIPKVLFTDSRFKDISAEAKILYGLLLDRMSLSAKNGWLDQEGRVYIVYTVEDIMDALSCASQKAMKLLNELDEKRVESIIKCRRNRYGFSCIIFLSEGRRKEVKTLNGYSYLTLEQRREIERMYAEGERVVDIAARLKRSAAAIYEELKRGYTGEFDGYARPKYSADLAQATVQENFRRRGNRRGANC